METIETIKNRRTIRKFAQKPVDDKLLLEIIDSARLAPYPANIQPLKFCVVKKESNIMFRYTKWAGYLENGEPSQNELPDAFIVTLGDRTIKKNGEFYTEGAIAGAVMSIAAESLGLGTCWLGAIDRDGIKKELSLPGEIDVVYLLAVGYPAQKSKAVEYSGSIKYYLDEKGELCVPKRSMEEIIYKRG